MIKNMKTIFLTVILLSVSFFLKSQNRVLLESQEEIVAAASAELTLAMSAPDGVLYKFGQENNITGEYNLQLTIRGKGDVVSVFVASKNNGNIPSQNKLKDEIFRFQFSFKMPKNKDYKFNYTFKF
jgi:hypothetical protein